MIATPGAVVLPESDEPDGGRGDDHGAALTVFPPVHCIRALNPDGA